MSDDRPFIIYTAQRTGGTNFTSRLIDRSSWPAAPAHEPFNATRAYGHVAKAWADSGDWAALNASMAEVCARGEIIKHCVETVPWEVTEALSSAALAADYGHLFLYRADSVARLLSLEYARRARMFFPVGHRPPSGMRGRLRQLKRRVVRRLRNRKIFDNPLDTEVLVKREAIVAERLNATWRKIAAAGAIPPLAISYEDLYEADASHALTALGQVLEGLGLARGAAVDAAFLEELRGRGEQGTRNLYARFKGVDELRVALREQVPPFVFSD